ncbi:RNA polymerase-binding protein DksA [Methylophilus sp. 5]|uniref:RNA polymerase-binding protein DksA n=1 Tax=Methylophilus sp. 5 TaxID=1112274 RepID=UPI00048A75A4|nr:RNA polymerase-binding protein DksA [Methylophilus sp. 5]
MLTEPELLAMPEDAYMNPAQLAYFQRLLESQRQILHDNMRLTSCHLHEQHDTPDPADRASQEESHGLELKTRERERKHLKSIAAALLRIGDGRYGYCEETGEPIGLARLLARPTTKLCLQAQERHERRERQFNH